MYIESVQIQGVRNLEQAVIHPNQKTNIFTGRNASGKTSFLEALHILARSKSFRTHRIRDVINHSEDILTITADIKHEFYKPLKLKIKKGGKTNSLTLNNENIKSVSELAKILPIITITQDSQQIITGSPKQRRHWLDWAMFHVEPKYLLSWKQYFKALRHRNILLKHGERKVEIYRPWEEEMIKLAKNITDQRRSFLKQLATELKQGVEKKTINPVEVIFKQGWPEENDLDVYLCSQREQDQKKGFTRNGPHQADITFQTETADINKVFSRGQIKIFVNQLLITQARVIQEIRKITPIVLIDDYTAELDRENSKHLLEVIKKQENQVFITTTEWEERENDVTLFHVEKGVLS